MRFGTMSILDNELTIGGMKASSLIKEYGSPLYVYDYAHIKTCLNEFTSTFTSTYFNTQIAYASKAFMTTYMAQVLAQHDVSVDCVSLGEMHTVRTAGFPMGKVLLHGNNKSIAELEYAIDHGVGYIVVDNAQELSVLIELAIERDKPVKTILRVNPGVEAHTHEYIITAKHTSKFGESIYDEGQLKTIFEAYQAQELVTLEGFHCHIGSQVFDVSSYVKTIDVMARFIKRVEETYNLQTHVLNVGGGFGVQYQDSDEPVTIKELCQTIIRTVEEMVITNELSIDELYIEPGRSIVANAGTTLYTVGYTKETYGGQSYLFVDGGMTDNIRPALYQAEYQADVATKMNATKGKTYTVAGKLCESGDVLIRHINLPEVQRGDIVAVYSTGAYGYSMASNYNRICKPAVVFVEDQQATVVVKRETLDDLLRNDV